MVNGAQPTGGFSLPTGEAVLVTPGGDVVGSAQIPTRGGSSKKRGGGSSVRAAREATLRRQKAEAEEKQRIETERRRVIRVEKEEVRQEKIESGKVSGQLSDARIQPASFEQLDPSGFGFTSGFRRSGLEATRAFFTEKIPQFISGSGTAFGNLLIGDTREFERINPFRVFGDVGERKGEKIISSTPQFGTATPDASRGFIRQTGFDVLRERRRQAGISPELLEAPISIIAESKSSGIERDVSKKFQQKIDLGQLTVEEATSKAGEQFSKEFAQQTSGLSSLGVGSLRQRSGERIGETLGSLAPAVGITALSFVPGGQVPAAALSVGVGGFFATGGRQKIREGDVLGGSIDIGTGALFAAGGISVLGSAGARLESQLTASRLASLQQQPISLGGDILAQTERGTLTKIFGSRTVGTASQEIEVLSPVFSQKGLPSGGETFSIVGGRFISNTRVEPFEFIKGFRSTPLSTITKTESGSFIGKGLAGGKARFVKPDFSAAFGKEFKPASGQLDFLRGDKRITTTFGGVAKQTPEGFEVISGSIVKARRTLTPKGLEKTFIIEPKAGGLIRGLSDDAIEIGGKSFSTKGSLINLGKPGDITGITQKSLSSSIGTGGSTSPLSLGTGKTVTVGFSPSGQVAQTVITTPIQLARASAGLQAGVRFTDIIQPSVALSGARVISPSGFVSFGATTQQLGLQFGGQLQRGRQDFGLGGGGLQLKSQKLKVQVGSLNIGSPSIKQLGLQEPKSRSRSRQSSGLASGFKQLGLQDLGLSSQFSQGSLQQPRSRQISAQLSRQASSQKQLQRQAQPSFAPSIAELGFGFGGGAFGFGGIGALPPFIFPTFPSGGVRVKGRKRRPGRIAPSLTGIALSDLGDIFGGELPTVKELGGGGLSPFRTRFVPISRRRKKSSRSKKKK